jgi:hypothetical protein
MVTPGDGSLFPELNFRFRWANTSLGMGTHMVQVLLDEISLVDAQISYWMDMHFRGINIAHPVERVGLLRGALVYLYKYIGKPNSTVVVVFERQCRGSLHFHACVWPALNPGLMQALPAAPRNWGARAPMWRAPTLYSEMRARFRWHQVCIDWCAAKLLHSTLITNTAEQDSRSFRATNSSAAPVLRVYVLFQGLLSRSTADLLCSHC